MTTASATPAAGTELIHSLLTHAGPIVVATDGTTSADTAVRAAAELSRRTGTNVVALAVLEPTPVVSTEYGIMLPPTESESVRQDALLRRVRAQMRDVAGADAAWTIQIKNGDPASLVARTAQALDARLVVLGLGHHDLLDRLFGGETALHALRMAHSPVFMVPRKFEKLPERILVATDFSPESLAAARAALEVLPGIRMVYLAHVAPRIELQPEAYAAWATDYGTGVEPAFARFRTELNAPAGVDVETVTLTGKPSRALLEFAKTTHVDAIVTGSHGSGLMDRILVGSTATGLVRGAHCALLALPIPLSVRRVVEGTVGNTIPESDWAHRLEDFTRRNAGRLAELEVDDPEIGAQGQQHGYPFLGAAYDHHDRRIELMMGEQSSTRHLTRGIGDIKSVDIMTDPDGHDRVLRIAHGAGQTILTLVR